MRRNEMVELTKRQDKKMETLKRRHAKLEDRIAVLMSQRVEIEEAMAAVYDDPR
jgi:hypothetical protein